MSLAGVSSDFPLLFLLLSPSSFSWEALLLDKEVPLLQDT